jgi:hypothetical protein
MLLQVRYRRFSVPGFDRAKQCLVFADEATTDFGECARVETFGDVRSAAARPGPEATPSANERRG